MTSHARSRWLGVWVRSDVAVQMLPFQLNLPLMPHAHWTDQAYQFQVPPVWSSQLQLSASECQIYDSLHSLPPAKRARFENKHTLNKEIIRSRVPDSSQVLPTLCASYTRQHTLDVHHVSAKGLFACLRETASGFHFFDPALFCSLFGATEHVTLSTKIADSFHFVGNAITIPHSVLALAIVLHTTDASKVDPIGLVRKVWSQRLTAYNAFLFAEKDFVHLIPRDDFWNWVRVSDTQLDGRNRSWIISGTCASRTFHFRVCPDQTIQQAFCEHCQGPAGLLDQICALNSDIRINNHTTIEQIARQEGTVRLVIGFCTIGTCDISCVVAPALPTKVICPSQAEDEDPSDDIAPFEFCTFDDIIQTNLFWEIQDTIGTLQDGDSDQLGELSIIVVPENFALTIWVPVSRRNDIIHRIGGLLAFKTRNKRLINLQGESAAFLVASEAQHCETTPQCAVILRVASDHQVCGAMLHPGKIPATVQAPSVQTSFAVDQINGIPRHAYSNPLQSGDLLDLCYKAPVHAGGHHTFTGPAPSLPAMADFTARVEFMCDTHGWAASDEMFHHTQALQWQQNWLRFGTPQMWNPANGDFESPVFGELHIMNNATAAIPVLIGGHWAGIEIDRQGDQVIVTFVQVPEQHHTALTFLVGRLLDIAPHRFQVQTEQSDPPDHLCGWLLIFRWYRRHGIQDGIADTSAHMTLNGEYNELIQLAMQCSSEDWARANAS